MSVHKVASTRGAHRRGRWAWLALCCAALAGCAWFGQSNPELGATSTPCDPRSFRDRCAGTGTTWLSDTVHYIVRCRDGGRGAYTESIEQCETKGFTEDGGEECVDDAAAGARCY